MQCAVIAVHLVTQKENQARERSLPVKNKSVLSWKKRTVFPEQTKKSSPELLVIVRFLGGSL